MKKKCKMKRQFVLSKPCCCCCFLDSVGVGPAFLTPNPDIPLLVIPGLDQDHGADEADHVHNRETEQGRVQLAQVAVRECRDLFFAPGQVCRYRRRACAREDDAGLVARTVPTALSVAFQACLHIFTTGAIENISKTGLTLALTKNKKFC